MRDEQTESWKSWVVPPDGIFDERDFHRTVSEILSNNRARLRGIDSADVELVAENHPLIQALRPVFNVTGGSATIQNSVFNGFYVAHVIVLRLSFS